MNTLIWKGEAVKRELKLRLGDALESLVVDSEINIEMETPVDTGNLQSSFKHEVDKQNLTAIIGNPVEYAGFVEFGTRKQSPNPYMVNGIKNTNLEQHFVDLL